MPGLQIRPAAFDDLDELARVQAAAWRQGFAGIVPPEREPSPEYLARRLSEGFAEPSRTRVVAELDGEITGWCGFGAHRSLADPAVGEIYALFVHPSVWRAGVGRALVDRATRELAARGFEEVALWSFADNDRANAFYERLGFLRDGGEQRRDELGRALEVRYRRRLGSPG